jgi:serine/threonine protein kinase
MDSGSLDKWAFKGKLVDEEKISILSNVAKALAHIHKSRIVHRDIAARNVLLQSSTRGLQAKLADFGMSRIVSAYQQEGTTMANMGPVRYMAPESLRKNVYSTKSDVWSFGCLCYEVIKGAPPHKDMDLLVRRNLGFAVFVSL